MIQREWHGIDGTAGLGHWTHDSNGSLSPRPSWTAHSNGQLFHEGQPLYIHTYIHTAPHKKINTYHERVWDAKMLDTLYTMMASSYVCSCSSVHHLIIAFKVEDGAKKASCRDYLTGRKNSSDLLVYALFRISVLTFENKVLTMMTKTWHGLYLLY